jgi:hypothetical protein
MNIFIEVWPPGNSKAVMLRQLKRYCADGMKNGLGEVVTGSDG